MILSALARKKATFAVAFSFQDLLEHREQGHLKR
jgi:hypothetical protein